MDSSGLVRRILFAQKDGFGIWGNILDTTGYESYVEITLLPEEKAIGRVVDEKGKPIARANVMVEGFNGKNTSANYPIKLWSKIAPKTETDNNGKFVLSGLPDKTYFNISCVADGYFKKIKSYSTGRYNDYAVSYAFGVIIPTGGYPEAEGELKFILEKTAKPAKLSGTVTYEKTKLPVEGVKVVYCAVKSFEQIDSECITDKDGNFLLENVCPGRGNLYVLLERSSENTLSEWTAASIHFDNLKPGQTKKNLKLVLVKGGIMSGKVTDLSGNPLKGIKIRLISAARPGVSYVSNFDITHTNEDGLWSYRLPPGDAHVFIETSIKNANWSNIKYTKKIKSAEQIFSNYSTKIKKSGQEINGIDFILDKELPENSLYR